MFLQRDPFRELDRLTREAFGRYPTNVMPLDAWQEGDDLVVELDLPGIDPDELGIDV